MIDLDAPARIAHAAYVTEELSEIISKGMKQLAVNIGTEAKDRITLLSRGLPHYTHALSLHAVRVAIDDGQLAIETRHVDTAIQKALDEAQQSTVSAYHKAVSSQRRDNLYAQVLLACALSDTDGVPRRYAIASGIR